MKKNRLIIYLITAILVLMLFSGCEIFDPKSAYPLKYNEIINKYASKYDLDPYLVAAVIHTESGFDENAISKAGAIGLMQIMPDTGEWIAGKEDVNYENYTSDVLYEPETNIEFGCWYLDFIKERFDSDTNVLAAYNAGHSRVAKWLEDDRYASGGELENIPYEETANYVKKVKKAYDKYKELYEEI